MNKKGQQGRENKGFAADTAVFILPQNSYMMLDKS